MKKYTVDSESRICLWRFVPINLKDFMKTTKGDEITFRGGVWRLKHFEDIWKMQNVEISSIETRKSSNSIGFIC